MVRPPVEIAVAPHLDRCKSFCSKFYLKVLQQPWTCCISVWEKAFCPASWLALTETVSVQWQIHMAHKQFWAVSGHDSGSEGHVAAVLSRGLQPTHQRVPVHCRRERASEPVPREQGESGGGSVILGIGCTATWDDVQLAQKEV